MNKEPSLKGHGVATFTITLKNLYFSCSLKWKCHQTYKDIIGW